MAQFTPTDAVTEAMDTTGTIYVLIDPHGAGIRYVGYTHLNPEERLKQHLWEVKSGRERNYKAQWMRGLLSRDAMPILATLEDVGNDWAERETFWIAALREAGCRLTNGTIGGDGLVGASDAVRAKMRQSHLGKPLSAEARANMSKAQRGRKKMSAEAREKIRHAALKRGPVPIEVREKIAATLRGRSWGKHSEETKARMREAALQRAPVTAEVRATLRAAHLGFRPTAEAIAKSADAHRGLKRSEETKARMSAAMMGHAVSDQTRARLSAATKAHWALKKQMEVA